MPVSQAMDEGMATPGSTNEANSANTWPPCTLTAPNSVIRSAAGEPPVVSRSTTTKVTAARETVRSGSAVMGQ